MYDPHIFPRVNTIQEYYDLLVVASLDGTFPSTDGITCRYRIDDGICYKACALGILIPNENYNPSIEGSDCYNLTTQETMKGCVPDGIGFYDLRLIQSTHDDVSNYWSPQVFVTSLNCLKVFNNVSKIQLQPQS